MSMYIMEVFKKKEQKMDSENIQLFNKQPNIGPTNLSVWGYTNLSTLLFASGNIWASRCTAQKYFSCSMYVHCTNLEI